MCQTNGKWSATPPECAVGKCEGGCGYKGGVRGKQPNADRKEHDKGQATAGIRSLVTCPTSYTTLIEALCICVLEIRWSEQLITFNVQAQCAKVLVEYSAEAYDDPFQDGGGGGGGGGERGRSFMHPISATLSYGLSLGLIRMPFKAST